MRMLAPALFAILLTSAPAADALAEPTGRDSVVDIESLLPSSVQEPVAQEKAGPASKQPAPAVWTFSAPHEPGGPDSEKGCLVDAGSRLLFYWKSPGDRTSFTTYRVTNRTSSGISAVREQYFAEQDDGSFAAEENADEPAGVSMKMQRGTIRFGNLDLSRSNVPCTQLLPRAAVAEVERFQRQPASKPAASPYEGATFIRGSKSEGYELYAIRGGYLFYYVQMDEYDEGAVYKITKLDGRTLEVMNYLDSEAGELCRVHGGGAQGLDLEFKGDAIIRVYEDGDRMTFRKSGKGARAIVPKRFLSDLKRFGLSL